jgi:hypothetical protein
MLQGTSRLDDFDRLDQVTLDDIITALERNATFESFQDFPNVIFEATQ